MWRELNADVETDLAALMRELRDTAADRARLLDMPQDAPPSAWDVRAVSNVLQSCYTGMENMVKRVLAAVDGKIPSGSRWHAELLEQAGRAAAGRAAIILPDLHADLKDFLAYRHVARTRYGGELDWVQVSALIRRIDGVAQEFARQVRDAMRAGESR